MNKIKIRKRIPRKSYSGSLIQQNFGELPENHGYLLWDIENGDLKEKNIDNEHKFINVDINQKTNIDDIKNELPKGDKIKVKIKWEDFSANMNTENEIKLKENIKKIYGTDSIKIEPRPLYTDIKDSKLISDTIDINNNIVQQNILKEFLKNNKIEEKTINKIIDIDDIINDRLNINKLDNIKWNIDKIWFNNFKSYGDNNTINWKDKNGIIQITGINQQGKSTILDAISYILYGTTMSTTKREKKGDNRYINRNRNKNYCDGGIIIDIDNEKYLIYRKTKRKIKNNGEISSVSTDLNYYKGTKMIEENKLVGERRTDTQKILESILGDFNDFIRLTLTSADNVNDLLSMDRSQFIDNIIKDAGFDIFDKKLKEFKDYKNELNIEKININVEGTKSEISRIKEEIENNNKSIEEHELSYKEKEKEIYNNQKNKELLIKKLHNIDDDIIKIDYDNILKEKELIISEIKKYNNNIDNIKKDIELYPKDFDNESLYEKRKLYESKKDVYLDKKDEINKIEDKIKEYDYGIKDINNSIEHKIREIKDSYNKSIDNISNNIKIIENDITVIKRDGKKIKNEINLLNNSDKDEKVCPTCLKPLNNNDIEHFKMEIEKKNKELKELSTKGRSKLEQIDKLKKEIENIKNIDLSKDNDYIRHKLDSSENKEEIINKKNDSLKKIESKKDELEKLKTDIKNIKKEIEELESIKKKYDNKLLLESNIKDFKINISNKKDKYREIENNIKDYEKNISNIKENKKTQNNIDELNEKIDILSTDIKKINKEISENNKDIALKSKVIYDYEDKIEKYKKQKELEFIHDTYMKSMHRDGLPTYLLKKSVHIINNELSMLLSDVDFTLMFDENLNLKMKSKKSTSIYNAVEGSGMERTFNSVVLKIALRKINNTSKPNFILFDEIMNKLVGVSVDDFIELLYTLKNHIDKIILIEHIHQLKYDYLIDVKKDKNGVSSINIY